MTSLLMLGGAAPAADADDPNADMFLPDTNHRSDRNDRNDRNDRKRNRSRSRERERDRRRRSRSRSPKDSGRDKRRS